MFSKLVTIELDKIDREINWEVITDAHVGNGNFDGDYFDSRIQSICNEPYRFTSFGGDNWDMILPPDPRFKDESVKLKTMALQKDEFEERCKDLFIEQKRYQRESGMDKIWYMQWGNHEYKSRIITEGDMKRYCRTEAPAPMTFLGSKAFVRLDIRFHGKSLMKKTLFVNHGAGSGRALKALEDLTVNNEADVYQMGHLHEPMGVKRDTYFWNDTKRHWDTKEQILVNSGCFVSALRDNADQWFEQKGNKMQTSKVGTWTVTFKGYENKVTQHG